jgi:hypothetical protein
MEGDRLLCVKGDRYPPNHRSRMVEIDKIVSGEKRGWVDAEKPNLQNPRSRYSQFRPQLKAKILPFAPYNSRV